MQATIIGASCVELARIKQEEKFVGSGAGPCRIWRMHDFVGFPDKNEDQTNKTPAQIFKAWIEDWEPNAMRTKDVVNEVRILEKYGGLKWRDPDNNYVQVMSDRFNLQWNRKKKGEAGYALIVYDEYYRAEDEDKAEHVEHWYVTEDMIESIVAYYSQHDTIDNIENIEKGQDTYNNEDGDTVETDEHDHDESKYY
jgi:hypothetical protein